MGYLLEGSIEVILGGVLLFSYSSVPKISPFNFFASVCAALKNNQISIISPCVHEFCIEILHISPGFLSIP